MEPNDGTNALHVPAGCVRAVWCNSDRQILHPCQHHVSAASPPWLCTPAPPRLLSPPAHWRTVTLEVWTSVCRCVRAGATRRRLGIAARQVLRRCSGAQVGQRLKIDTDQRLESDRKNSRPNCRRDCVEQAMSSRCAGLNPAEAPAPERHLLEHGVVAQVC